MAYVLVLALILFTGNVNICDTMSIQCTFYVSYWPQFGSIYYCHGTLVTGGSMDNVTSVSGSHQTGKSDSDVLGLYMPVQNFQYFPRNVEAFFPNIIMLSLHNNNISSISHDHLAPFPNLQYLEMSYNRLTSLDSNLFAGLNSIKLIQLSFNNIMIVGHEFILPNTAEVNFQGNTCIDKYATNADQMSALRFSLLVMCPPTIKQIETTIESRDNLITRVNTAVEGLQQSHTTLSGQVQSLVYRTDTVEHSQSDLENKKVELTNEVTWLQQSNAELTSEVTSLTDEMTSLQHTNLQLTTEVTRLQQSNVELTEEVTSLTHEVTDLQQSNVELTNRNSQLETRIGFLDTRAGYLEIRVAQLESIIESNLGLKISETISENENNEL